MLKCHCITNKWPKTTMTTVGPEMNYDILVRRTQQPAWLLLRSGHAPLVVSFLCRIFIEPNVRSIDAAELTAALEDELFELRERHGEETFPKTAQYYLNDWASPEKGWLRKFYRKGTDEAQFDLTPSTEKAIAWVSSLSERGFVGTESRLLTLFQLLKQMSEGSEADPAKRIAELHKRRDEINTEIDRVVSGDIPLLDDVSLRDRFQQFMQVAKDLLTDFREVEHNFRILDRQARKRIALWDGTKGDLLDEIIGDRDTIANSEQGRSFRAFWDFLMSSRRQEELSEMLAHVLTLPAVADLKDARVQQIHYDWLDAGDHTQRMVAQLSQQLRRFLDDKMWLENRRIMDILRSIETKALSLRENPPSGAAMSIEVATATIELPMERPLYPTTLKPIIAHVEAETGDDDIDMSALYSQVVVDRVQLANHIRQALQEKTQVTLCELIEARPLQYGLAELLTYLQLSCESFKSTLDEDTKELITWETVVVDGAAVKKQCWVQRVIFVR